MDLFKGLYYRFPEEKPEICNSVLEELETHLKSQDINATSPSKTQHVTHTFGAVQQDCLTLKVETT